MSRVSKRGDYKTFDKRADKLRAFVRRAVRHGAPDVVFSAVKSGDTVARFPDAIDLVDWYLHCVSWWERLCLAALSLSAADYEAFVSQSEDVLAAWLGAPPEDVQHLHWAVLADQRRVASAPTSNRSVFMRHVAGRRQVGELSPLEVALGEIPRASIRQAVTLERRRSAVLSALAADAETNLSAGVALVYQLVPLPGAESMSTVRSHARVYGAYVSPSGGDGWALACDYWFSYMARSPQGELAKLGWSWTTGKGVRPVSQVHVQPSV